MNIIFIFFIAPLAFVVEYLTGYLRYKSHPLNIIGLIAMFLKKKFYKLPKGIISGIFFNLATIICVSILFLFSSLLIYLLSDVLFYIFCVYILSSFLSTGGLKHEALKIYKMLKVDDIKGARNNLSSLAGRDANNLDGSEISRAVVESVSENTGDGIGSIMFYFTVGLLTGYIASFNCPIEIQHVKIAAALFLGLLSAVIYKTVNLLDSIIGYKNEEYEKFGKFSARLDDVLNFIPFRITALFMILSTLILSITLKNYNVKDAVLSFIKFRKKHPSPNGGQLESVTAGALNIKLGGVNYYGGVESRRPVIGFENYKNPNAENIIETVKIMEVSSVFIAVFYTALLLIIYNF